MTMIPNYERITAKLDAAIAIGQNDGVMLTCGADLTPEPISWLWPGWLAQGKLHILAGAPGQGKTTIAQSFAATITTGGRWPDGQWCKPGNVLIWSGEDDPADTLLPRLLAAGADRGRVYFVSGTRIGGEEHPFDPARDLPAILGAVEKIGGISSLIVDPIVSAVAKDGNSNTDVRRALQPLVDLAAHSQCAVLGISHFSKGGQGQDPTQRVVGSVAFGAVARVVLVAAKVNGEDGEPRRILARSKSNIGPDDGGFEYRIEQSEPLPGIGASYISWGQEISGNARELLAEPERRNGEQEPRTSAAEFLQEVLSNGSAPVKTIRGEASDAGHTWRTVQRAADDLHIIKRKGGMADGWYWSLPKNPKDASVKEWTSSISSEPSEAEEEVL